MFVYTLILRQKYSDWQVLLLEPLLVYRVYFLGQRIGLVVSRLVLVEILDHTLAR